MHVVFVTIVTRSSNVLKTLDLLLKLLQRCKTNIRAGSHSYPYLLHFEGRGVKIAVFGWGGQDWGVGFAVCGFCVGEEM